MENEIWIAVKGFPLYQISNFGRVKSLSRKYKRPNPQNKNKFQVITTKEKIINGWIKYNIQGNHNPVCINVVLRKNNKTYEFRVHRLVLVNFIGKCPKGKESCHNDGNPFNNHISNLRWDTHKENIKDCIKHGKKTNPPIFYGEKHHNSKFSDKIVNKIRNTIFVRGTQNQLARKFGVAPITIARIKNGLSRSIKNASSNETKTSQSIIETRRL